MGIDSQTDNYSYQILSQGDRTQSVIMTAAAKIPGLRSYTGAVFLTENEGQTFTITAICETDEPSSTPPAIPTAPSEESAEIQCPSGSHRIGR